MAFRHALSKVAVIPRALHRVDVRAFSVGAPSTTDRLKEAFDISKEHVKAAVKNQTQGAADVLKGRASAGKVASEHGHEAKQDMKQWKNELHQALQENTLPGEAHVREVPPMYGNQAPDTEIKQRMTKQGMDKKPDSRMPPV